MKLNQSLLMLISIFCMISCGSDDDSATTEDQNSGCSIEVISVNNDQKGSFTFTIKNGNSAKTGISAELKYFKNGVIIGGGAGVSASNIDANETFEITTISTEISSTDEYDCAEYTLQVFTNTNVCNVDGPECP